MDGKIFQVLIVNSRLLNGLIVTSILLATPIIANAGIITIASGPGNEESCTLESDSATPGASCTTQLIDVHPLWQENDPDQSGYGGEWVFYDDTGK